MEPLLRSATILILAFTLITLINNRRRNSRSSSSSQRSLPLPPGPQPDSWFWGHKLPSAFAYRKFEQWTQTYGPIFSLRQMRTNIIVIGRYQAAVEIMEREGAALVDRPLSIAAGETLSGGMRVVLTPAGERFKKMRKALHAYLAPKVIQSYHPLLMRLSKNHILSLLTSPHLHQNHAKRYAASVVMSLAYGKLPSTDTASISGGGGSGSGDMVEEDPDVLAVNRCLTRLGENVRPGLWKVDFFPVLRYVPGYLKELKEGHKEELGLFRKHLEGVREQMQKDRATANNKEEEDLPPPPTTTPDCFAKYLLERQTDLSLSTNETAYLAGALFGAGSDTTASAISVAILAAACYPLAAQKVQQELDSVVGRLRAPVPKDWEAGGGGGAGAGAMPELHAFVLETFRWRPVTAGGFAHKATRDIIWGGYVIPAGSTVIGNVWSVGRDPTVFKDPEKFDPSRWLELIEEEEGVAGNGKKVTKKKIRGDLKSFPFGFGRRVCPGQHMALSSVLLNTALIQWAFHVRPDPEALEKEGPIDELAFTESANAHPMPFKVVFEPRVAGGVEGVREALEGYGEDL